MPTRQAASAQSPTTASRPTGREIGPWGTAARVAFGAGLLAWARADGIGVHTVVVAVGLAAAVATVQLWRMRRSDAPLELTSPLAHCLNAAAAVALVQFDLTRSGALVFYGVSALVAAARGVAGCEVTALTNWALGRRDQVGCPLFAPVDALETPRP